MNNIVLANQSIVQTSLLLDPMNINTLEQALLLVQQQLQFFANDAEFSEKIRLVFGEAVEAEYVESLKQNWLTGDFSILSGIEIRTSDELSGFNGAYAQSNDKIYLSSGFLQENQNKIEAIAAVLLEEAGHRIDAQVNLTDKQGDEGEHFSLIVRGESISDEVLAQLQVEDDHQVVEIDGENIEIETNSNTITITGKIEWTDNQGNKHPVRGAVIEVIGLSSILETGADGTYQKSITIAPDVTVKVLGIKVFAQSETSDIKVKKNKDSLPYYYYYQLEVPVPILNAGGSISLPDLVIPNNGSSNTKAFSIYDAMYVAQKYAEIVRGEPLEVMVNFPFSGGSDVSNFDEADGDGKPDGNNNLNIEEIHHRDWDTLFHEYSHYLGAEDKLNQRLAKKRSLLENLIAKFVNENDPNPKNSGISVAWAEGLANYLGIAIQEVAQNFLPQNLTNQYHIDGTNYSSLSGPGNFHGIADTSIYDLEDKATEVKLFDSITGNFIDINSLNENQRKTYNSQITINQSEANELTVARILLDLADDNQDIFESGLKDEIAIGHVELYDILNNKISDLGTLNDIWNFFAKNPSYLKLSSNLSDDAKRGKLGAIFEEYGVSPHITKLPSTDFFSFEWEVGNSFIDPNDTSLNLGNDEFEIVIFDETLTNEIDKKTLNQENKNEWNINPTTGIASWTPKLPEWYQIGVGNYNLVIKGKDTRPGIGEGNKYGNGEEQVKTGDPTGYYWSGAYPFEVEPIPVIVSGEFYWDFQYDYGLGSWFAPESVYEIDGFKVEFEAIPINTIAPIYNSEEEAVADNVQDEGKILLGNLKIANEYVPTVFDEYLKKFLADERKTPDGILGYAGLKLDLPFYLESFNQYGFHIGVDTDGPEKIKFFSNNVEPQRMKTSKGDVPLYFEIISPEGEYSINDDTQVEIPVYGRIFALNDPRDKYNFYSDYTNKAIDPEGKRILFPEKSINIELESTFEFNGESETGRVVNKKPIEDRIINGETFTSPGTSLVYTNYSKKLDIPIIPDTGSIKSEDGLMERYFPYPGENAFGVTSIGTLAYSNTDDGYQESVTSGSGDTNTTSQNKVRINVEGISASIDIRHHVTVGIRRDADPDPDIYSALPEEITVPRPSGSFYQFKTDDGTALPIYARFMGARLSNEDWHDTYTQDTRVIDVADGDSANFTYYLHIFLKNNAPIVKKPILDQEFNADQLFYFALANDTFTDPDGDNLTYSATLADGSPLPTWLTFDSDNLTFSGTPNQSQIGTYEITVIANDDYENVSDEFILNILVSNNALIVNQIIEPITVDQNAENTTIDLSEVFADVDNDDNAIAKSFLANTNESLPTATIVDNQLILDYEENQSETAEITVRATSNGKSVDTSFIVTVSDETETTFDIDGDGQYLASVDGLLFYGYLNIRGLPSFLRDNLTQQLADNLINPDSGATRTSGADIASYLEEAIAKDELVDIDGDGEITASIDGLLGYGYLNIRSLPPFLRDNLTQQLADNLIPEGSDAIRTTGTDIANFIESYIT